MSDLVFKNIFRFIVLILLQVLILNNIQFSGYINPYLYVLFIILLPFNTPNWLLLILAFLMGFSIDMFTDTLGLHSAATVFMAFCRPAITRLGYKKQDYESGGIKPTIRELGFRWFFTYSLLLVSIHHIVLFFFEAFNFQEFFNTFFRTLLSVMATMILVILSQYMFQKNK